MIIISSFQITELANDTDSHKSNDYLQSIHDSMNISKIEFITYIYILYYQSSINFQFLPNLASFPDIFN